MHYPKSEDPPLWVTGVFSAVGVIFLGLVCLLITNHEENLSIQAAEFHNSLLAEYQSYREQGDSRITIVLGEVDRHRLALVLPKTVEIDITPGPFSSVTVEISGQAKDVAIVWAKIKGLNVQVEND